MNKAKLLIPLFLITLIPSCRSFEGLDKTEQDTKVILHFDGSQSVSSVSVIAPGVGPVKASEESKGVFSFIRKGYASRVPAWYCIFPERTDIVCDGQTSVLSADLPSVQYPASETPDKFSMLAVSPAFNLGPEEFVSVQSPDSLVLPYTVKVSGLEPGVRIHSVSFAATSLEITGPVSYDVRERTAEQTAGSFCHSVSLQIPDGLPADNNGTADIPAVSFLDLQDYCGPAKIFISTENQLYALSIDTLSMEDGKIPFNLASGAKKSAAMAFDFNDSRLFNTLSTSATAKITASDGTVCNLELTAPGCAEKNVNGVCCLCIPAGQWFKVPDVAEKEVTGILFQLSGAASEEAVFNVFSGDELKGSFSASTSGPDGGLTALSISDFPEEMEISNLSGMKIVPAGETSRIAGFVLTIIDYVDPHSWEDGHIDDGFTDLFDIL